MSQVFDLGRDMFATQDYEYVIEYNT